MFSCQTPTHTVFNFSVTFYVTIQSPPNSLLYITFILILHAHPSHLFLSQFSLSTLPILHFFLFQPSVVMACFFFLKKVSCSYFSFYFIASSSSSSSWVHPHSVYMYLPFLLLYAHMNESCENSKTTMLRCDCLSVFAFILTVTFLCGLLD